MKTRTFEVPAEKMAEFAEIIGEHVRTMLQEDLNEDRLEISA